MLLSGILNQDAKIPQVAPAVFWLCSQVTFLALVKQLGIITVKKFKVRGAADEQEKNKQIDYQEAIKGDAIQLQRWWKKLVDF